ncbi:AAA family ATPase [Jannaschia pohangensis]|uniref:AAA family ATPase n=1 Tax=Jannaschia pohangensis TaxID=390807 RepID=UPI0015873A03|nr:AAA family ATPase [Jannaschia pohangensis]
MHDLFGLNDQGCDVPLAVSMFADVKAQRIEPARLSLRQIHARLTATTAPAKSDLPLVKLGTFGDVRTEKGSLRHDANLLSVSGVEGDYDAGEVSPQEAADRLDRAGIAALVYTTPSHTAEVPRFRVLLPLATEVAPAERAALCARLNGALGGILAAESFTPSQSFYFGSVTSNPVESFLVEGQTLDRVPGLPSIGPAPKPVKLTTDLSDLFRDPADRAEVRRALALVKDADDRDQWLNIGMALHAEFNGSDEGYDIWSHWSRLSLKFDERSQRRTWKSFRHGGIGIGTLFKIAMDYGYEHGPFIQDSDFDDLPALPEPEKPKPSTLTFLTPDECEASPARKYLIKGLLAEKDVACIFGAPGAGKSLIAPFLGYMLAQGNGAFGIRTKAGGVFYVASEDSHGMRGRVKALRKAHGSAQAFKLVEGVSNLLIKDSPDYLALKEAVKAERPALIFIDTLAMAFPGLEENSAEAMGRVVAVARALTRWGAAVVLIHHDTKAEGGTPRGHSLLNGALDVALHVKRDDEQKIIRGRLTKNRNGTCDRGFAFTIATDDFGFDDDGDPLTYPRCNPLTGIPAKVKRLPPQAAAALKILEGMPQPVNRDDWKNACMASDAVCANDDPATRRKAFNRSLETLARDGLVSGDDGFYSIRDGFDDGRSDDDETGRTET